MADIGKLSVKITADSSGVTKGINQAKSALNDGGKSLEKSTQQWSVWGAAAKLAATGVGAVAVRQIISYSDAVTSMSNKLRLSTNSTQELARVTQELYGVANDTRSSVESTVDLYSKLERSTRDLGIEHGRLLNITSLVNKSFTISGASAQEASGSIRQLGQALASGVLRGDEFNSVAEGAPIILEAVTKALGVTRGEVRELAADGKITADVLINSLEAYAETINSEAAKATKTFGQQAEIANNNLLAFVQTNDSLNNAVGLSGEALVALSEHLDLVIDAFKLAASVAAGRLAVGIGAYTGEAIKSAVASTKAAIAATETSAAMAKEAINSTSAGRALNATATAANTAALANVKLANSINQSISANAKNAISNETLAAAFNTKQIAIERSVLATVKDAAAMRENIAIAVTMATAQQRAAAGVNQKTAASIAAALAASENTAANLANSTAIETQSAVIAKNTATQSTNLIAKNNSIAAAVRMTLSTDAETASQIKASAAITANTAAMGRANVAANVLKVSLAGLNSVVNMLGGPVGVLITAATAFALFYDAQSETEKRTKSLNEALNKETKLLRSYTTDQLKNESEEAAIKLQNVTDELFISEAALAKNQQALKEWADKLGMSVTQLMKVKDEEGRAGTKTIELTNAIDEQKNKISELLEQKDALKEYAQAVKDAMKAPAATQQEQAPQKQKGTVTDLTKPDTMGLEEFLAEVDAIGQEIDQANAERTAARNADIEDLRKSLLSELEYEKEFYAEKLALFSEAEAEQGELTAQQYEAKEMLKADHLARMAELEMTPEDQRIREENERILEALLERHAMIEETELGHYERQQQVLDAALAQKLITEEQHAKMSEEIAEAERQAKVAIAMSAIDATITALDLGGKKANKLQKALAIANAVIAGKEAAVSAWKAGMSTGGPWAPAVAAAYTAASIARTASMINSIRSSGSSSGGGGGGGGVKIPAASGGGDSAPTQQAPQAQRNISINLTGSAFFSTDQVRQLIGAINEQIGDGVTIKT